MESPGLQFERESSSTEIGKRLRVSTRYRNADTWNFGRLFLRQPVPHEGVFLPSALEGQLANVSISPPLTRTYPMRMATHKVVVEGLD